MIIRTSRYFCQFKIYRIYLSLKHIFFFIFTIKYYVIELICVLLMLHQLTLILDLIHPLGTQLHPSSLVEEQQHHDNTLRTHN